MSKPQLQKNLSDTDRQLCGLYLKKDGKEVMVIPSRKYGKEYLEIAEVKGFAKAPLFEEISAKEIREQIKSGFLTKK